MNINNNISVGTRETGEFVLVLKWTTPTFFYFKRLRVIQIGGRRKMFTLLAAGLNFVQYPWIFIFLTEQFSSMHNREKQVDLLYCVYI